MPQGFETFMRKCPVVEGIARLKTDELEELEFSLAKEAALATTLGVHRDDAEGSDASKETREEIIGVLKRGVSIATHAESLALIPLAHAAGTILPPSFSVANKQGYDFYFVEVTFSVLLDRSEYPSRAQFQLVISDDIKDSARKCRPIQLFPKRTDRDYFRFDLEGGIGIDARVQFTVPMIEEAMLPFKEIAANSEIRARFLAGPFSFRFRKAEIEVIGESSHEVGWRYNIHTPLQGANSFKSLLVLKVAKEAKQVELAAELGVVPCRNSWLLFEKRLPVLRDKANLTVELVK